MDTQNIIKEMERLQKEVQSAKAEVSKAEGYLESIMETLKNDFGVDSFDAAMKLLKKWEAEEEAARMELEKVFTELQDKFDW